MTNERKFYHILVVDDDARIRELLQKYLVDNGYFVSIAKNTDQALNLLNEIECHLIILDVMMPGETGVQFTKKLRTMHQNNIPIIMLTAMGEVDDKISGLETGADDYLVKPFEPKELLLRIQNLIRRTIKRVQDINFGDFNYNLNSKVLFKSSEQVFLTHSEGQLINLLLKNSNSILSREYLASSLKINERSVDVQIIRLRNKIEANSSRPKFLQTIRNQGYIFRV